MVPLLPAKCGWRAGTYGVRHGRTWLLGALEVDPARAVLSMRDDVLGDAADLYKYT